MGGPSRHAAQHQIPLRTDRRDVQSLGFTEIDLVAHCGSLGDGEFVHSLTAAVLDKSQVAVQGRSRSCGARCPSGFGASTPTTAPSSSTSICGTTARRREIQFTPGRPYKKRDNAHIEQKNWTHVRKLLGYVRYDSAGARAAIHALYRQELRFCSWRRSSWCARNASARGSA